MKSFVGTMLIGAAWVAAAVAGVVTDRWWVSIIVSVPLTLAAYRVLDWRDKRAAENEALAATASDYRLVRH